MKLYSFTKRLVIDTNVIVSALLSPNGSAAKFIGDVFDEKYEVVITGSIYSEYDEVLHRSRFNIDEDIIQFILSWMSEHALYFEIDESDYPKDENKKAQLAYSFNIALQNELSLEDNLDLARAFVMENLMKRGMVCDFALHAPGPKEGGDPNPHFHVLAPIRPLTRDGKWDAKQHREYRLDENGERIRKPNGEYDFTSVPTTDWGRPETLEVWRKKWSDMVNKKFIEKGLDCRIDNRLMSTTINELLCKTSKAACLLTLEAFEGVEHGGTFSHGLKIKERNLK